MYVRPLVGISDRCIHDRKMRWSVPRGVCGIRCVSVIREMREWVVDLFFGGCDGRGVLYG